MWARSPSQLSHVWLPVGLNNWQPLGSVDESTKKVCFQSPQDNGNPKAFNISSSRWDLDTLGWGLYGW